MVKENDSGNHDDEKKNNRERKQYNQGNQKEVVQALKKEDGLTWEEDGVVYIEERVYVLNNKIIRKEILKKNHNSVDVEHLEQQQMLEPLKRNYWWPELNKDVKKYIQECFRCQ